MKSEESTRLLRDSGDTRMASRYPGVFPGLYRIASLLDEGADVRGLVQEVLIRGDGLSIRDKKVRAGLLVLICSHDRFDLLKLIFDESPVFILPDEVIYRAKASDITLLEYCIFTRYAPKCLAYLIYRERIAAGVCRVPPHDLERLLKLHQERFPESHRLFQQYFSALDKTHGERVDDERISTRGVISLSSS